MLKLTRVEALDPHGGDGTAAFGDLVGAEDLIEMWQFNFVIDIEWVMAHVAPGVRAHFVHGYHPESNQPDVLRAQAAGFKNVDVHSVRLRSRYGTHHSKLMILSHKRGVQIVVHTANLIEFDWTNMTQGVWASGFLELEPKPASAMAAPTSAFKQDFLSYLAAYEIGEIQPLMKKLERLRYPADAQFIASVPGSYTDNRWGLRRLTEALRHEAQASEGVCQVSSIGVLPETFLERMRLALRCDKLKIVFPTVDDISNSLNGYRSGSAVHMKRQTRAQQKQLERLRPRLCKWVAVKANRARAAPHIKTYIAHTGSAVRSYLLTSANLSQQAWGIETRAGQQWIQSWECGVLLRGSQQQPTDSKEASAAKRRKIQTLAAPYDLPLVPYQEEDLPWSPQEKYATPDWLGQRWP